MNTFVKAAVAEATKSRKDSLTANGAVTRTTSGQSHLDLFAIVGSARNAQDDLVRLFSKAYSDDKYLALRIMLWARDIRGGAGERQVFRNVLKHLSENDPKVLNELVRFVPEFGRWDDVIDSVNQNSEAFKTAAEEIKKAIDSGNGLAAKWTPRKGAIANKLRSLWNMSPKHYRKYLVTHTAVVETKMCAKQWDDIEFDKVPSVASLRYQSAFSRNASQLYEEYKAKLISGKAKINAGTLFPHNIVANIRHGVGDTLVLNEQWKALPDYLGDKSGKVLVMSDVSGSMECPVGGNVNCMDVSIALGLYISERLTGAFKDLVLTFSADPEFHKVQGVSISERVKNLGGASWGQNTNLQAAFALVLQTALDNRVSSSDMPETIVVVSDMEFDHCGRKTNFGAVKKQYAEAGYRMPNLVFWNVNGRAGNSPVKHDSDGTCMVSGFSPAILDTVLSGKEFDPMQIMLGTIMKDRYDVVDQII